MRLTLDEALAMLEAMEAQARRDADEESPDRDDSYWDGWADGLATLRQHIATGVKVTCFPVGSCSCHPFTIGTRAS
jgi:hypothetical protein